MIRRAVALQPFLAALFFTGVTLHDVKSACEEEAKEE
jgi:hypothetical protein